MIIAVASGKGGTGKTLVSTALVLSAGTGMYVDLDVEEPNGAIFLSPEFETEISYKLPVPEIDHSRCTFCGECANACVYNALAVVPEKEKTIFFPGLCHSCGVCSYVCPAEGAIKEVDCEVGIIRTGSAGTIKGSAGTIRFIEGRLNVGRPSGVPLIAGIIENHLPTNDNGLIIMDSPPGTSCPVVETLKNSDYVILVTEPTPFGRNDLELAAEVARSMDKPAGIIINKDTGDNPIIDDFARQADIPILMRIPYNIEIQRAYSKGIPLTQVMPEMQEQFKRILDTIMKEN